MNSTLSLSDAGDLFSHLASCWLTGLCDPPSSLSSEVRSAQHGVEWSLWLAEWTLEQRLMLLAVWVVGMLMLQLIAYTCCGGRDRSSAAKAAAGGGAELDPFKQALAQANGITSGSSSAAPPTALKNGSDSAAASKKAADDKAAAAAAAAAHALALSQLQQQLDDSVVAHRSELEQLALTHAKEVSAARQSATAPLQVQLEDSQAVQGQLQADLDRAQGQLVEVRATAQEERQKLETVIAELQAKNSAPPKPSDLEQAQAEQIETLTRRITELQDAAASQTRALEEAIAAAAEERAAHASAVVAHAQENEAHASALAEVQEQLASALTKAAAAESSSSSSSSDTITIAAAEAAKAEAEASLAALIAQHASALSALSAESALELSSQSERYRAREAELQALITELQSSVATLTSSNTQLQSELKETQTSLQARTDELEAAVASAKAAESQHASLLQQSQEHQQSQQQSQQQAQQELSVAHEAALGSLASQLEVSRAESAALNETISSMQQAAIVAAQKQAEQQAEQKREAIVAAEAAAVAASAAAAAATAAAGAEAGLQEQQQLVASLQSEVSSLQEQLQALQANSQAANNVATTLPPEEADQQVLTTLLDRVAAGEQALESAEQLIRNLQSKIEQSQTQAASSTAASSSATAAPTTATLSAPRPRATSVGSSDDERDHNDDRHGNGSLQVPGSGGWGGRAPKRSVSSEAAAAQLLHIHPNDRSEKSEQLLSAQGDPESELQQVFNRRSRRSSSAATPVPPPSQPVVLTIQEEQEEQARTVHDLISKFELLIPSADSEEEEITAPQIILPSCATTASTSTSTSASTSIDASSASDADNGAASSSSPSSSSSTSAPAFSMGAVIPPTPSQQLTRQLTRLVSLHASVEKQMADTRAENQALKLATAETPSSMLRALQQQNSTLEAELVQLRQQLEDATQRYLLRSPDPPAKFASFAASSGERLDFGSPEASSSASSIDIRDIAAGTPKTIIRNLLSADLDN